LSARFRFGSRRCALRLGLRDGIMVCEVVSAAYYLQRGSCAGRGRFVRLLFFGKCVVACPLLASVTPNNSFKPTPLRGAA